MRDENNTWNELFVYDDIIKLIDYNMFYIGFMTVTPSRVYCK